MAIQLFLTSPQIFEHHQNDASLCQHDQNPHDPHVSPLNKSYIVADSGRFWKCGVLEDKSLPGGAVSVVKSLSKGVPFHHVTADLPSKLLDNLYVITQSSLPSCSYKTPLQVHISQLPPA